MSDDERPEPPEDRLGQLLTRAQTKLARTSAAALARHGVDGHELAVLAVLSRTESQAQLQAQAEVAVRLGVDRTTMVSLIDGLEDQGLVEWRRSPRDRRKNIIELTAVGKECLTAAERARRAAERRFLAPLGEEAAESLVRALRVLAAEERTPG
jgi:DNA-binding MarR family transcriptional regulator